jgi:[ribosomal protein S18]-alanine N-acetyltransferase
MKWRVDPMTESHVAAVVLLERSTPGAAHWTPAAYAERLVAPADLSAMVNIALVAIESNTVIGFVVGRAVAREVELENIVVAESHRRQGVGAALLDQFMHECERHRCESMHLEVRSSNEGAREFYQRGGFSESGTRGNYYANPVEDAVVMGRAIP